MRSRAEARPERALGLASCVLLGLYLAYPDRVYVFDGVMFSGIIERANEQWRAYLFNPRHLLFNPFLMAVRDLLGAVGLRVPGYELIQRVNAVFGVFGIAVYYALLRGLTGERAWSGIGALAFALSLGYWTRATEGQVYMLMTFWSVAASACALRLIKEPTCGKALALGACAAAGILFHAADAVLILVVVAAMVASRRRESLWALAPFLIPMIVYVPAVPRGGSLLGFAAGAADVHGGSWTELLRHFIGGLESPAEILGSALLCVVAWPWAAGAAIAGGVAVAVCVAAAAWLWIRREDLRASISILAVWGGSFVLLDALWHGGAFFWCAPLAAGLAVATIAAVELLAKRPEKNKKALGVGALAALSLGAANCLYGIFPQSKLENNVGYTRAMFVRDHTVPRSWVLLSGFGFPNAKAYIPHFAHRPSDVLEYYLANYGRTEGLARFSGFIRRNLQYGIPIYLLSDLVEDNAVLEALTKRWSVGPDDIRGCFGYGRLLLTAQQDQSFRIFLFVPRDHADLLFATLSYSLFNESDQARMREMMLAVAQVGAGLTAEQRRGMPALMRGSDYGALLSQRGFDAFLNEQSKRASFEEVKAFDAQQGTPKFHFQVGRLYESLGLFDEVRREWAIAYKETGDPQLKAMIAKLPR